MNDTVRRKFPARSRVALSNGLEFETAKIDPCNRALVTEPYVPSGTITSAIHARTRVSLAVPASHRLSEVLGVPHEAMDQRPLSKFGTGLTPPFLCVGLFRALHGYGKRLPR